MRRTLHRRLLYPVYDSKDQLSTTTSDDAAHLVYTGGFGQTDVWHTLGGALEALEEQVDRLPAQLDPRRTPLVLFRLLLSSSARAEMVRADATEAQWRLHLQQLTSMQYHQKLTVMRAESKLCAHAADVLLDAFDLDLKVSQTHAKTVTFPGPGAVLVTMMDRMQRERAASAQAKAKLDQDPLSSTAIASHNGCSAENVGTHTLMSKDATSKEPMRPEAVALAKHASAGIAKSFLQRVAQAGPTDQGVDWDSQVRFYIRGVVAGGWESEVLAALKAGGDRYTQPDVASLRDQPQFPLLGPGSNPSKLAAHRAGTARAQLEAYYRAMES
jgi:hypothetical protein